MWVLIVVAVLLGVVILYNLTNINVSERIRELSTIKVLGFYDKEVTLYIYRETIILTLLGIWWDSSPVTGSISTSSLWCRRMRSCLTLPSPQEHF